MNERELSLIKALGEEFGAAKHWRKQPVIWRSNWKRFVSQFQNSNQLKYLIYPKWLPML